MGTERVLLMSRRRMLEASKNDFFPHILGEGSMSHLPFAFNPLARGCKDPRKGGTEEPISIRPTGRAQRDRIIKLWRSQSGVSLLLDQNGRTLTVSTEGLKLVRVDAQDSTGAHPTRNCGTSKPQSFKTPLRCTANMQIALCTSQRFFF